MSYLIHNLPPIPVKVRKEFLYDHQRGHGEYVDGIWASVKSITGKALYFETLLPEYGALYDKLPISAFLWHTETPSVKLLSLDTLQLWDCFDYYITIIQKPLLTRAKMFGKDKKFHHGDYMFTIDTCHSDDSLLDTGFSETDPEHKSFNILRLDNGQFAAQPNNRCVWSDASLIPSETKMPDFKVCTQNYSVEGTDKWNVASSDEWQYKSNGEK